MPEQINYIFCITLHYLIYRYSFTLVFCNLHCIYYITLHYHGILQLTLYSEIFANNSPTLQDRLLTLCSNCICRVVKKRLQALREHIDDLVAEVDSETTPLRSEAIEYSGDYKDFNLGFRILLCSLLQVC